MECGVRKVRDACKKNALLHTSSYTLVMQFAGVGISFEKTSFVWARLLGGFFNFGTGITVAPF